MGNYPPQPWKEDSMPVSHIIMVAENKTEKRALTPMKAISAEVPGMQRMVGQRIHGIA